MAGRRESKSSLLGTSTSTLASRSNASRVLRMGFPRIRVQADSKVTSFPVAEAGAGLVHADTRIQHPVGLHQIRLRTTMQRTPSQQPVVMPQSIGRALFAERFEIGAAARDLHGLLQHFALLMQTR